MRFFSGLKHGNCLLFYWALIENTHLEVEFCSLESTYHLLENCKPIFSQVRSPHDITWRSHHRKPSWQCSHFWWLQPEGTEHFWCLVHFLTSSGSFGSQLIHDRRVETALQKWKGHSNSLYRHKSRLPFVLAVTADYQRTLGKAVFVLVCHCPSFKGTCFSRLLPTPSKWALTWFCTSWISCGKQSAACPCQCWLPGLTAHCAEYDS